MMKLTQAASFFHRTPFYDPYNPDTVAFKGRVSAYDDNARDSLSTERRIMTVAAGVAIPPRRVVAVGGEKWIVGAGSTDFHGDDVLREKYILHRADDQAKVQTFEQALLGTGGQDIWAGRLWIKEMKEPEESSGLYASYHIYMSSTEDIRDMTLPNAFDGSEKNVLITMNGRYHLVRSTYDSAGGMLVAVTDELPDPVKAEAEFVTRSYQRATDTHVEVTVAVQAINLRWQSYFTYLAAYSPKFEEGDHQLMVLKSAITPKTGDKVTLRSREFKVVTVIDQGQVWAVHVRRV